MNKISEKAVWDDLPPSQDEMISPTSFGQSTQPQMMFCYKCNQVIPANSAFCPWCQIELYATCPKCGNKYSSQYPACNQCGTNREIYLAEQEIREKELMKKQAEAAKQQRLREEAIKEKQIEEERQRQQEKLKLDEIKRVNKNRMLSENFHIVKTQEYILTENFLKDFFCELQEIERNQQENKDILRIVGYVFVALSFISMLLCTTIDFATAIVLQVTFVMIAMLCFSRAASKHDINIKHIFMKSATCNNVPKEIEPIVNAMCKLIENGSPLYMELLSQRKLTDLIILAYRKTYNMNFNEYRALIHDLGTNLV